MDKLKPCPFCGGEARVFEEWGVLREFSSHSAQGWRVISFIQSTS